MKKVAVLISSTFIIWYAASCTVEPKTESNGVTDSLVERVDTTKYMKAGNEIVKASFAQLKSSLFGALSDGGLENALSFCNENAYTLTDSLSKEFNVDIKRVAVKYRNPGNKTDEVDEGVYTAYSEAITNNNRPMPVLRNDGGKITYYAPIMLGENCLKCHGNPETQIGDSLYKHITALYPDDKAINFQKGDLRGMWRISFND